MNRYPGTTEMLQQLETADLNPADVARLPEIKEQALGIMAVGSIERPEGFIRSELTDMWRRYFDVVQSSSNIDQVTQAA